MSAENLAHVQAMAAVLKDKSIKVIEQIKDVDSDSIRGMINEMTELLSTFEPQLEVLKRSVEIHPPSLQRDQILQAFTTIEGMIDRGHAMINAGLGELNNRGEQL